MTETSPKLGLPYIQPAQAQKHVTHNEAIRELDTLVQLRIAGFGTEMALETPALGETHALGPAPGGAWAGQGGQLATWDGVGWQFLTPLDGWLAWDEGNARIRVYSEGFWIFPDLTGDQFAQVGVSTAADATNRLAVASDAVLLTHAGTDHRLKVNKAAVGDTASLLFQSDWTGHAEMGLAGDNAFSLKVSADGSAWSQVMRADPVALQVDVPLAGSAVQSSSTDATVGRLMKTGAFGLGLVTGGPTIIADIDDNTLASGTFRTDNATVGTFPTFQGAATTSYGALRVERRFDSAVAQTYTPAGGLTGQNNVFFRVYDSVAGAWKPWRMQYNHGNVLAAVSHASGTPTGGLIERGSNASGAYVRFADGTQICTHTITLAYATSSILAASWVYPATFSHVPFRSLNLSNQGFDYTNVSLIDCGQWFTYPAGGVNATFNLYRQRGAVGTWDATSQTTNARVFAIGRWF